MVVGGYMYYRLGALVLNYVHFLRPLFSKMHRYRVDEFPEKHYILRNNVAFP